MTYIKSESTPPNQSPNSISAILHLGSAAAQKQDWLALNNYLKQLPQTKSRTRSKRFILKPKDWQIAFDLAISMLVNAEFQHKWSIVKILPLFGEEIIPTLTALIKDPTIETDVCWFICQALGNFSNPEVILALVELLESTTDAELIEMAGKTLTKIGDEAIDALEDLLTKPQHRFLAVQSLYYIRTAKTIEPLIKVATDPSLDLRAVAIEALGSFHNSHIPPILINALKDKASKVRRQAVIALGFRADLCQELGLVNHLRPMLLDFDLEVCRHAATSLCRMKNDAATAALFEVLQADTTPNSLKLDLVKALCWSEIPSGINYLEQALVTSTLVVTQEIITGLGRTSISELKPLSAEVIARYGENCFENLQESLELKQALATSLGELRCSCGRKTLEKLAQDSDRKVKLHAISALKKLNCS